MDKYQKAAALDLIKMTGIVVAVSVALNILALFFTLPQIVMGGCFLLLVYTGYNLYLIRVDQHRALDEIRESRSK